ncbi:serpin-type proteinase inhibitor 10 [Vairimorpha necatrix]|uniref:Serpin-type proteinase inhibitor 10 n=1 Tax=Vairimorpha necatrix TaxID=6039 RepID=A0AAX4JGM8_9MICR
MNTFNNMMLDISNTMFYGLLQESENTLVFSPLSVINLLWLYYNGSENLKDRNEYDLKSYNREFKDLNEKICNIFESTHWYKKQSKGFVYINNFVFYNKDLKLIDKEIFTSTNVKLQEFKQGIKAKTLSKLIKRTVNKTTKWKINEILNIKNNVLTAKNLNTAQYKSVWKTFFSNVLVHENFYIRENKIIKIQMMQKKDKMLVLDTNDFIAVGVSLNIANLKFVAVLPKNNKKLQDIHYEINKDNIYGLHDMMAKAERNIVNLKMPKFTVESKFDIFKEMKTEAIGNKAEFTDLLESFLKSENDYEHVAMVDINEQGVKEKDSSSDMSDDDEEELKEIILNRPFLFYIVDSVFVNLGLSRSVYTPIFMGKYSGNNNEKNLL